MKPTIFATIILAGFVTAVGAGSIITAEYQLIKNGAAVADLLRRHDDINIRSGQMVADRYDFSRAPTNSIGSMANLDLQSDSKQEIPTPVIDIQSRAEGPKVVTERHTSKCTKSSYVNRPSRNEPDAVPVPAKRSGFHFVIAPTAPALASYNSKANVQFVWDEKQMAKDQKQIAEQVKSLEKLNWDKIDDAKFKLSKGLMQLRVTGPNGTTVHTIHIDTAQPMNIAQQAIEDGLKAANDQISAETSQTTDTH